MINIKKKNHKFIIKLFHQLIESGTITKEESSKILSSLTPISFDWKRLARFSLWTAVISVIISITAAFTDQRMLHLLGYLITAPAGAQMIGYCILATICYWYKSFRSHRKPQNIYTNNSILLVGVFATASAIFWLGEFCNLNTGLFLLATLSYGTLGLLLQSQLIWSLSFLSLGAFLCFETGDTINGGTYFLGLNYPLRLTLLGLTSLVLTVKLKNRQIFQPFYPVTRQISLLYLFLSLWMVSIFGNCGDITSWLQLKQTELLHWSLLFGCASVTAIYLGCKWEETIYKGFGIVFLFVNFYTRFFELFWNILHPAIFFSLIAASLWYLGSKAEKIWLALRY